MTKGTIRQGKQLYRALATQLTGSSNKFHVGGNNQVKTSELIIVSVEMCEETEISPLDWQQTQPTPGSVPLWFLTVPCRAWPCHPSPVCMPSGAGVRAGTNVWRVEASGVEGSRAGFQIVWQLLLPLCLPTHNPQRLQDFSAFQSVATLGTCQLRIHSGLLCLRAFSLERPPPCFWWVPRGSSRYPQNMFSDLWGAREGPPCPGWRSVTHL